MTLSMFDIVLPRLAYPEIEVVTAAGTIDLHNFARFVGFEYLVDGELEMRWMLDDPTALLAGRRISLALLRFGNVDRFSVSPRNPEIPKSEDSTMEDYRLMERSNEKMRFVFVLGGGAEIDVSAESVALWAD